MRMIFCIVTVLGLFVLGFSVFQIRAVRDYRDRVRGVQDALVAAGRREVAEAHRMGAVFTGQTWGDVLIPELDGIDKLQRGWFVVAFAGVATLAAGIGGFIACHKQIRI
jgi:hypothetical protein